LGEADLILRRGNLVVVVEVKYAGAGQGIDSVLPSFRQLKRIENAALIFQSRHPEYANAMLRLDIIVVRPWGRFRRIRNAGNST
jgi:putative endonuclease